LRAAVQPHIVFALAEFLRARREDDVLRADGVADVTRRQTVCLELLWIQIDHDLTGLASVRQRNLRALDSRKLSADKVQPEIVELLFGERLAAAAKLENRNV
jgi:hypothetical protein